MTIQPLNPQDPLNFIEDPVERSKAKIERNNRMLRRLDAISKPKRQYLDLVDVADALSVQIQPPTTDQLKQIRQMLVDYQEQVIVSFDAIARLTSIVGDQPYQPPTMQQEHRALLDAIARLMTIIDERLAATATVNQGNSH